MKWITALLQDREAFLSDIVEGKDLASKILGLCSICGLGFFIYGFIVGLSHSPLQALSAGIKLPILYLLTLLICLPTLYIFNSLFGSSRSINQTLTLLLTATCVISLILVGFAPITLFFLISTTHYQFFKLLNVGIFGIAGLVGIRFFYLAATQFPDGPGQSQATRLYFLKFWLLLYAFVGSQLGWTLRPFFGTPELPFELIRELRGNFYADIISSIGHILGFH